MAKSEKPRTPAPRVLKSGNTTRVIPAAESCNISPAILSHYQEDALQYLDKMRKRILDGEVIGFGIATITIDEGEICISHGWTAGFIGYGINAAGALSQLSFRYNHALYFGEE